MSVEPHRTGSGGRRRAGVSSRPAWGAKFGMALAAVVLTSGAVATGVFGHAGSVGGTEEFGDAVDLSAVETTTTAERSAVVSRSDRRDRIDPAKEARLDPGRPAAQTGAEQLHDADPRSIARALLSDFGFAAGEFGCLDSLWQKESGWNPFARNASSGAYGIPQSLPGSKMASAGADWSSNPVTQITWGLGYIRDRYGSPCAAWSHSQSVGWY